MTREEAIKTIRLTCPKISDSECDFETAMRFLIPELAESEDERIRKYLIEELKAAKSVGELKFIIPQPTREECIAYLEKQKENPKSADSIPSDCVSDAKCEDRSPKHSDSDGTDIRDTPAYWKGWDDAMKQKEQKHPNGCFTCDEYKKGYESGRSNGFTAGYNKAMKEVEQKEQKPEEKPINWTELTWKDIVELEGIINNVHYEFRNGIGQESFGKEVLEKFREYKGDEYLDEIEQKPLSPDEKMNHPLYLEGFDVGREVGKVEAEQKPEERFEEAREKYQVEWSEEDDQLIGFIFDLLNDLAWRKDWAMSKEECLERLKSLRPQPKQKRQIKEGDKVSIHCRKDRKEGIITIYDGKVGEVIHVWDAKRNPWGHISVRLDNGCNNGFYEDELEVLDEFSWKPSEDEERLINTSISFLKDFADKGYENAVECIDWLKSKLNGNACK